MKSLHATISPRVRDTESGQALPMLVLMLVLLLAVAALAIDMGNLYWNYQQLVSQTQAAAMAGGEAIISTNDAVTVAKRFSGQLSTNFNYHSTLNTGGNTVSFLNGTPKMGCVNPTTYPNYGLAPCTTFGPNNGNSIQVTETTKVPTYFARIFGLAQIPITATAVASATGGPGSPWNVAIVVDTTASMSDNDGTCGGLSRLACSMRGVQTLMKTLTPCAVGAACTAGNAVDRVSLFTFPNMTTATATADYCGGGSNVSVQDYTFPPSTPTSAGYTPVGGATYQLLGFLNDYQVSPVPQSGPNLSTNSNLSKATGVSGSGCSGLKNPGGAGTYYAGVIYAAQATLLAQQAASPTSRNAMILLSDGDSTAQQSDMGAGANNTGVYPSWVNECGQAVTAATVAAQQGTRVYSVAYGTKSGGCASDKTVSPPNTVVYNSPCKAMQAIGGGVNSPYFYSDANSGSTGCNSGKNSVTNLNSVFLNIGASLTGVRLLPGSLAFQ